MKLTPYNASIVNGLRFTDYLTVLEQRREIGGKVEVQRDLQNAVIKKKIAEQKYTTTVV